MSIPARFVACALCFGAGYGVPLVALAAAQDGFKTDSLGFHTSSRMAAVQTDLTQDEMEALRLRLWALTEPGGTIHCDVNGITAPCASTVAFAAPN